MRGDCPNCGADLDFCELLSEAFRQCNGCGLTGPVSVFESLAAKLAPAGVLAEAERLLRGAEVFDVLLCKDFAGAPDRAVLSMRPLSGQRAYGDTLAQAYNNATKGDA